MAERRRLLLILLAAAALQAWLFRHEHVPTLRPLFGDEIQYHARALAIAAGRPLPPDFLWPPLGSWFLGAIYFLAGPSRWAVETVQVALFLACGLLLRLLARKALRSSLGADLAMAFLLLDPQVASFAHYLWPEVLHLALLLGAVALLFAGRPPRTGALLAAGALAGLAVLTKSILGPFVPVLAAAAALRPPPEEPSRRWKRAASFLAGLAVVVAPVALVDGVRYGRWGVANSGWFNLWVGLTDPPAPAYDANVVPKLAAYVASGSGPEERERFARGEIRGLVAREGVTALLAGQLRKQYVRLLHRSSFFTDQLPGGRLATGSERLPADPRPRLVAFLAYAAWCTVLVLGTLGIAVVPWARLRAGLALPALWIAYTLALFLALHVKTRYRIPALPALDLFAAESVLILAGRERPGGRSSWFAVRLACGALLAALAAGAALAR